MGTIKTDTFKVALAILMARFISPKDVWNTKDGDITISTELTLPKNFVIGLLKGTSEFNKIIRDNEDEKENAELLNIVLSGCIQEGFCHWMENDCNVETARKALLETMKDE